MNNELNTRDILNLFKKNRRMIILVILFFSLLGGFVSFIIPPTYEVKTDLLVNYKAVGTDSSQLQSNEIDMSLRLIETYKYMLISDRMIDKVITEIKESYTKAELRKLISIESIYNSQIISIVAREKTPEKAALLANTYANSFQEEVKKLMNLDNINILNEVSSDSDMKVIKMASILAIVISFVLGVIVAVMIILIQEFYFTKLNTISKAEGILNIPNIGTVPIIKTKRKNVYKWDEKLITDIDSPIIFTEEFRRIRANLKFHITKRNAKTVLVTSPNMGDGKSLVSRNLAIIMAMGGEKTVYVDADLRKPVGRGLYNLPERMGLISHILGHCAIEEIIQETETKNLSFVSSGPIPPQSN